MTEGRAFYLEMRDLAIYWYSIAHGLEPQPNHYDVSYKEYVAMYSTAVQAGFMFANRHNCL